MWNNPYRFPSSALCKRIKRFSPVLSSGTTMVIYVKFQSLLLFLSFWDDHSPCWFSKCSKAGSASSTLKKIKIIIWFRHWRTSVWMTTGVGNSESTLPFPVSASSAFKICQPVVQSQTIWECNSQYFGFYFSPASE